MKYSRKFAKKNKNKFEEEYSHSDSEISSDEVSNSNKSNNDDESNNNFNNEEENSEAELYLSDKQEEKPEPSLETYEPTTEEKKDFANLLISLRSNIDDINKKMEDVTMNMKKNDKGEIKYGISYLDAKNHFMLTYLNYLTIYSLYKAKGQLIASNPIIKKLIYLKTILEKTKIIDLKLKSQIDRLLKLGEKDLNESDNKNALPEDENNFRPKILEDDDQQNGQNEEENEEENMRKQTKYKVQKNFQEFFETSDENKSRQKRIEKIKQKVRNSEIYKDIKDQFSENPLEITSYNTEYSKFMKEIEDYEDNYFTRVKVPKRELKKLQKMERQENDFTNIGKEFKNLESILKNENKDEYNKELKFINRKRTFGKVSKQKKRNNKK